MNTQEWRDLVLNQQLRRLDYIFVNQQTANRMKKHYTDNILHYSKLYSKYKYLDSFGQAISSIFSVFDRKRPIFFNFGHYLKDIVLGVKNEYPIVLGVRGYKSRVFSIKNKIKYVPLEEFFYYLNLIMNGEDKYVPILRKKVRALLLKSNPICLISFNDSESIERLFMQEAKDLGIPTIDIQHGIFQRDYIMSSHSDGLFSDYLFVWGEYFKNLYSKHRNVDSVKVLGFPYKVKKLDSPINLDTVYIFDQGNVYDKKIEQYKLIKTQEIGSICEKLGYKLIFREYNEPYSEKFFSQLSSIANFEKFSYPLAESIKNGHIFLSYNSTTLFQSFISGRLSIQLLDFYPKDVYSFNTDNYASLGGCDKTVTSISELENFLKLVKVQGYSKVKKDLNQRYIQINENPSSRLLMLLRECKILL